MDLQHILNPSLCTSNPITSKPDNGISIDIKDYECSWNGCNKIFRRKSELVRHQRTHTGERPYECIQCGKRFIQRSALTVHFRIHTGERPYPCDLAGCSYSFGDSSSLARHIRGHLGVRPHLCQYTDCDKAFTRRNALVKHHRKHEEQVIVTHYWSRARTSANRIQAV